MENEEEKGEGGGGGERKSQERERGERGGTWALAFFWIGVSFGRGGGEGEVAGEGWLERGKEGFKARLPWLVPHSGLGYPLGESGDKRVGVEVDPIKA